jgi:hypothetical protein
LERVLDALGQPGKERGSWPLLGTALLICFVFVGSFTLSDLYGVSPVPMLIVWNSILMIPLFWRDFRSLWKKPSFVAFFVIWMLFHGLVVVALMRWTSIINWPVGILLELTLGLLIAHWLFGVSLDPRR